MINTSHNGGMILHKTNRVLSGAAGIMLLLATCPFSAKANTLQNNQTVTSSSTLLSADPALASYAKAFIEIQNSPNKDFINNYPVDEKTIDTNINALQKKSAEYKKEYTDAVKSKNSKEIIKARTYLATVNNEWAKEVLKKENPSESELEKVIDEMRYIVSWRMDKAIDELKLSPQLLNQLDNKMEVYNEARKKEINKKLDGIIDEDIANDIADASLSIVKNSYFSKGYCAKYVRLALEKAKILGADELRVGSAKDLKDAYPKTGVFTQVDITDRRDIENLPRGCVVVVQNGKSADPAFEKHGHVFITQGNGKATSDYNQYILNYKTSYAVFVPTKKTLDEKYQDAIQAKDNFYNSEVLTFANQSKYFNRYIKWAEAVIKDGHAPKEMVDDLVDRFKDLPEHNKVSAIQPMVKETQNLLAQVKSIYNID